MKRTQRPKSNKIRRRAVVRQVAVAFRDRLSPRAPGGKTIVRQPRQKAPHYELAKAAVNEFIDTIGDALSQNRTVKLRGFGNFVPRQYKPMTVRLPGADADDKDAAFTVPVRLGVQFQPSPKLKKRIRDHDAKHGIPRREPGSSES